MPTDDASIAAACSGVPTRLQRYEKWVEENAPHFPEKLVVLKTALHDILDILPSVLVSIVFEYATREATWLDTESNHTFLI